MIKTTKNEISEYWQELKPDYKLSSTHCWRCGIKKRLDRCHIQANAIDGIDHPKNFVLLCKHCHIDSPNVENPEFIWEWLDHYRNRSESDLWFHLGVREYNDLYDCDLYEVIKDNQSEFEKLFSSEIKKATRHFGQPAINPASVAGVIREVLKSMNLV